MWDPTGLCRLTVNRKRDRRNWISWNPWSKHRTLGLSLPDVFSCQREINVQTVSDIFISHFLLLTPESILIVLYALVAMSGKTIPWTAFEVSPPSPHSYSLLYLGFSSPPPSFLYFQILWTPLQSLLIRKICSPKEGSSLTLLPWWGLNHSPSISRKKFLIYFLMTDNSQVRHFTLRLHISAQIILKIKTINGPGSNITQRLYNTVWNFWPLFIYFLHLILCIHSTDFFKVVFQDYKYLKTI